MSYYIPWALTTFQSWDFQHNVDWCNQWFHEFYHFFDNDHQKFFALPNDRSRKGRLILPTLTWEEVHSDDLSDESS